MASQEIYPLSFEQRDYLVRGKTGFGTIAACTELTGPVDAEALEAATRYLLDRHEPLRMRLTREPGRTGQVFLDTADITITVARESIADSGDVYRHAAELIHPEETGPVVVKLLQNAGAGPAYVVALLDHLACDGWGSYLYVQDLWAAYRAIVRHSQPELPPLTLSYSRYVMKQEKASGRQNTGWQETLRRSARSDTGIRLRGTAVDGGGRADMTAAIQPRHVTDSRRLAHMLGLSGNVIPLGCVALASWSISDHAPPGLSFIYSGRDTPATRAMVGLFRRYVSITAAQEAGGTLGAFLSGLSASVLQGIRSSRPPYSAAEFEDALRDMRSEPVADLLYNQVDKMFGDDRLDQVQRVDTNTTAEIVPDPHFSPIRWRAFREPRLRLVLGGGGHPVLQAIFNVGCVAEQDVRQLLDRAVAIAGVMHPGTCDLPVSEIVRMAAEAQ